MSTRALAASAAVAATLVLGCSSNKILVPPRLDLAQYGTIGMIEFSSAASTELAPVASREFLATIFSAQPGVPVLELGTEGNVLGSVERPELDVAAVQAIGKRYLVDALVVGTLDLHDVTPNVSVGSGVRVGADVEGSLNARILDTRTGATIWTSATRGRQPVAHVGVDGGGLAGIGARDPDQARSRLVLDLVDRATADLWPRWERQ